MIRVLLAEDEPPTLRRIHNMIERLDPDFQVVKTALNGTEALAYQTSDPCDVVFTDIRMPEMDGLQMMDEIHILYPHCIVVVISGYKEFEYVTHALRSQAVDYLLKPVSEEEMQKLLVRVKELYYQKKWEKRAQRLSMLAGLPSPGQKDYDEKIAAGVALFCVGSPLRKDCSGVEDIWAKFPLQSRAEKVDPGAVFYELRGNTVGERILIRQGEEIRTEEWARGLYEEMVSADMRQICCICTDTLTRLSELGRCVQVLRTRLVETVRIGTNLFSSVSLQPGEGESYPRFPDLETARKLYELLREGRFSETTPFRRELFSRLQSEEWPQLRIYELFMQAASLLSEEHSGGRRKEFAQFRDRIAAAVCDAESFEDLDKRLGAAMPESREPKKPSREGKGIPYEIRRYLQQNYSQQHVTTQMLSAEFGYVPGYISQLFKQEFGISPIDYLMQYRIEKAKEMMKQHPEMLIGEISEQVGFTNQHHFSRTFKKYEGMWPSSYRS